MAEPLQHRHYEPFPSFSEWQTFPVDAERWTKASERLRGLKPDAKTLESAFQLVRRYAAVDTGAIEGLYQVEQGITFTIAAQGAAWEAALQARIPQSDLIKSQLEAYDLIVDLSTGAARVNQGAIRHLHEVVCASQHTYTVMTAAGPQERPLHKGVYKTDNNNVLTVDGVMFDYCPVESTAAEMTRLVDEINGDAFARAHAVLQAAYAHYAFVLIHPFEDGNGRVSRLLSSLYLCKAASIPLLVLADQRPEYLMALRAADVGNGDAFVAFVESCAETAFRLAESSVRTARLPKPELSSEKLRSAYVSRSGVPYEDLSARVAKHVKDFHVRLSERLRAESTSFHGAPSMSLSDGLAFGAERAGDRGARGVGSLQYEVMANPPIAATVQGKVQVEFGNDPALSDTCLVRWLTTAPKREARLLFEAPMSEFLKERSAVIGMEIELAVESILRVTMDDLADAALRQRRQSGF